MTPDLRSSQNTYSYSREKLEPGVIDLVSLLVVIEASWPFLLVALQTYRFNVSQFVLLAVQPLLALLAISLNPVLDRRLMLSWGAFCAIAGLGIFRSGVYSTIEDSTYVLCQATIACAAGVLSYDLKLVRNIQIYIGLVISTGVILESVTHVFSTKLLFLFGEFQQNLLVTSPVNGGLLPQTAAAGLYIMMGLGALITLSEKRNAAYWIHMLIFIYALVAIRKRAYWLDLVLTLLFLWGAEHASANLVIRNKRKLFQYINFAVFLAVVAVIAYRTIPQVTETMDLLIEKVTREDSTLSGRTQLYAFALDSFKTSPLFGIGWGTYRSLTANIFSYQSDFTYKTHNVYLQLLCETGIVGVSAFLLAAGSTLQRSVVWLRQEKREQVHRALRFSLYAQAFFLTYCMSGNPLYDSQFVIAYFLGIMTSYYGRSRLCRKI